MHAPALFRTKKKKKTKTHAFGSSLPSTLHEDDEDDKLRKG